MKNGIKFFTNTGKENTNMSNCPLNEELDKILEKVANVFQRLDRWFNLGLNPCRADLSAIRNSVDEIRKDIIATLDEINKRKRLGSGTSLAGPLSVEGNVATITEGSFANWSYVGKGAFSVVFSAQHNGTKLAVKILQPNKIGSEYEDAFLKEVQLMSILRHDNIVAFRYEGMFENELVFGVWRMRKGQRLLAMEYLPNNLMKYVMERGTHEKRGLPENIAWDFAAQIACGLAYLHDLKVAHRDLKPDNILINPGSRVLKISDFGEAYKKNHKESTHYLCSRYAPPEMLEYFNQCTDQNCLEKLQDKDLTEMFMKADVYTYGNTVAFCTLGIKPWQSDRTEIINEIEWDRTKAKIHLPTRIPDGDPLKRLILNCYEDDPEERPATASVVLQTYFSGDFNPYELNVNDTDFFTCGFLRNTKLYVADSLIKEMDQDHDANQGKRYSRESLTCEIKLDQDIRLPEESHEWDYYSFYCEKIRYLKELTEKGEIKKDTSVALKCLNIPLRGNGNDDSIQLKFCETSYVHHRSMREIWRELSAAEKQDAVPNKRKISEHFSTSFGLHVAVLTTDKQILFFQRENSGTDPNQGGLPAPNLFTCTVTKSLYKESYVKTDKGTSISLLHSAAHCLSEELNIHLSESEYEAINFHTVYLKFDNHEWGMCGYIDLSSNRIDASKRLKSTDVKERYTSAKKTKHNKLFSVTFDPHSVATFVSSNLPEMASSTKMVAVKVLKAFYSSKDVEDAFKKR